MEDDDTLDYIYYFMHRKEAEGAKKIMQTFPWHLDTCGMFSDDTKKSMPIESKDIFQDGSPNMQFGGMFLDSHGRKPLEALLQMDIGPGHFTGGGWGKILYLWPYYDEKIVCLFNNILTFDIFDNDKYIRKEYTKRKRHFQLFSVTAEENGCIFQFSVNNLPVGDNVCKLLSIYSSSSIYELDCKRRRGCDLC